MSTNLGTVHISHGFYYDIKQPFQLAGFVRNRKRREIFPCILQSYSDLAINTHTQPSRKYSSGWKSRAFSKGGAPSLQQRSCVGFAPSFLRGLFDPAKLQDTIKSTLLYSPVQRKSIFTDTKLFTFYRIYSKIIKSPIELFDFVWYLELERQPHNLTFYVFPTDIHMECNQPSCCHSVFSKKEKREHGVPPPKIQPWGGHCVPLIFLDMPRWLPAPMEASRLILSVFLPQLSQFQTAIKNQVKIQQGHDEEENSKDSRNRFAGFYTSGQVRKDTAQKDD